jgi:ubiquinone/menaquinone biosynthesis C-methylase UbiE
LVEFTGERVIPGKVDPDLWNEHFARYAFAARLARQKKVLDIGCGAGYGSAELARVAAHVTGVDSSEEAIAFARENYVSSNLAFQPASATALPFPDASFDLVVAFELIEHLAEFRSLLSESRRLLMPGGQFVVSTPNKKYYSETRSISGPNPFHLHEFAFDEFRQTLSGCFPHVSFFLQNHTNAIVFHPLEAGWATEVRSGSTRLDATEAHFFIAVCALLPQTGSPTFVYIPTISNVLREREQHILRLEAEITQKNEWLEKALRLHEQLVFEHQQQTEQLEQRNRWAAELNQQLEETSNRVVAMQDELAAEQKAAAETVAQYEEKIQEMDQDLRAKAQWALDTESRLTQELAAKSGELARCVSLLQEAEATVEERTKWAQSLDLEKSNLEARLSAVRASRWYQLGRTLGLGPELRDP